MKINQKKLQAYRKANGQEILSTPEKTYDIVLAQFLIEQDDRDSQVVNVDEIAEACGFDCRPSKEEDGYLFFSNAVIDHEHSLKELDLNKPLIFANGRLIDGHHRAYRAFMLGVETMQAHTLTAEEVRAC